MPQKQNPIELVELRLLQQDRIQYSDGVDWMRMMLGIIATVISMLLAAQRESGLLIAITMMIGLILTVAWIMCSGKNVAATRKIELEALL